MMHNNLIISVPIAVIPGEPNANGYVYSEEVISEAFNRCKDNLYLVNYKKKYNYGKVIGRSKEYIVVECKDENTKHELYKLIYKNHYKAGLRYSTQNIEKKGKYYVINYIDSIECYEMIDDYL